MARPIILGVVGDSATGKTTLSRGLVRMLGDNNVTFCYKDHRQSPSYRDNDNNQHEKQVVSRPCCNERCD